MSWPSLWSAIEIDHSSNPEAHVEWLKRASNAPLTVRIRIPQAFPASSHHRAEVFDLPVGFVEAIAALAKHNTRIRSMHVEVTHSTGHLLPDLLDFPVTNMRHLECEGTQHSAGPCQFDSVLFQGQFPRLRSVTMGDMEGWFGDVRCLTTLRLRATWPSEMDAGEFFRVLLHSPALRSLYVEKYYFKFDTLLSETGIIPLDSLTEIKLVLTESYFILSRLNLPNIDHLELASSHPLIGDEDSAIPLDLSRIPIVQRMESLWMQSTFGCKGFRFIIDGCSARLEGLSHTLDHDDIPSLDSLSSIYFPLLERIKISTGCDGPDKRFFANCPRLRRLEVHELDKYKFRGLLATVDGAAPCSVLKDIVVKIGRMSCTEEVITPLRSIIASHAAGVQLWYKLPSRSFEEEDGLEQRWKELCARHGVQSWRWRRKC